MKSPFNHKEILVGQVWNIRNVGHVMVMDIKPEVEKFTGFVEEKNEEKDFSASSVDGATLIA